MGGPLLGLAQYTWSGLALLRVQRKVQPTSKGPRPTPTRNHLIPTSNIRI